MLVPNTFSKTSESHEHLEKLVKWERTLLRSKTPRRIPQHNRAFYKNYSLSLNEDQQKVVLMTIHAWESYRKLSHWHDAVDIVQQKGFTVYDHDMAYTLVDSLDTLFIMGLHSQFDEASAWAKQNLEQRMFASGRVSFFETSIRSLGGLLSAYTLSREDHWLQFAMRLADRLSHAFVGPFDVPCQMVDLSEAKPMTAEEADMNLPSLAEAGTFQLEFMYLSRLSGKKEYQERAETLAEADMNYHKDGLLTSAIDWDTVRGLSFSTVTLGAQGDSYYEYLLKQWIYSKEKNHIFKLRYELFVDEFTKRLVATSSPSNLVFIGELRNGKFIPKMQHLACFVPGMLALGYFHGMPEAHLTLAKQLMETCVRMYTASSVNLAPESVLFKMKSDEESTQKEEMTVPPKEDYHILRPETVESLMILYRVTKDDRYRSHGRAIMTAIEEHAKVSSGGYRNLNHVFKGPVETREGPMESFFIAETLKYLFLLFSNDTILSLDKVVFNTEAHPFDMVP